MTKPYDFIYLSPHLDDVILSCGAQIFQHVRVGQSVMIVTVMAGDPPYHPLSDYARALHQRWQIHSKSVAARREEDKTACAVVGAEYHHWNIPDCIYRRNPESGYSLYSSDDDIFGAIDPFENHLIRRIQDLVANLPKHHQLLAPLSIGNHVDHQLVRKAAELSEEKSRLKYYEEYPYITNANDKEIALLTGSQWRIETVAVAERALWAKIEAISCYRSQISTFFSDIQDISHQVCAYTDQEGGEKLWRIL